MILTNNKMKLLGIAMYVLIFGFALYIGWIERQDWECPTPHSSLKDCDGNGMPHRDSKPEPQDTCPQLIQRIRNAAGAERKSIKWRKALVLSVMTMAALWFILLSPGTLPVWTKFYLSVLIVFVIIRAHFAWYSYHRFKNPEEHIYEASERLKQCIHI